jgi:KUP system potassium uptake protein
MDAPPTAVTAPVTEPTDTKSHDDDGPSHARATIGALSLAALGVVYGDIGTSPLYALKECVHGPHAVAVTQANVLGLLSLMVWSVVLVVSVKYLTFIMRADNQGEGGILALLALIPERVSKTRKLGRLSMLTALILFGAALLYGDGIITPAISVLSAVEGLEVATTKLQSAVIPLTVAILVGVFAIQKHGTASIGRLFGPIMVVWFTVLAVLGVRSIIEHPNVLKAISPHYAVSFFAANGFHGFAILGSVVLCVTGGEALYADMGHFGRRPVRIAWYGLVLPALVLNYFGQGALLIAASDEMRATVAQNPFYALVPQGWLVYPLVALSTAATIIASQALISGAFSLTRQAAQLGYLPRVTIKHTSSQTEGQIYIPSVNWALAIGCVGLVLAFKASSNLAAAYGIAVTGTMAITSIAFYVVARERWHWSQLKAGSLVAFFLVIDLAFLGANALKFIDGGFVPIAIAIAIFFAMRVWKRGRALLAQYFTKAATPLESFLEDLGRSTFECADGKLPIVRTPGVAVFLTSSSTGTPPLLMHHVRHNLALHATVLLVTVTTESVPRVTSDRFTLEPLDHGFYRVGIRVGFMETPDVPRALDALFDRYELGFSAKQVTYYLGRETLLATSHGEMGQREEQLFAFLTKNSQNATRYFAIPPERVVEIGMQIDL